MPSTYYYTKNGELVSLNEMSKKIEECFPSCYKNIEMILSLYCVSGKKMKDIEESLLKEEDGINFISFIRKLINEGYELGDSVTFR